VTRYVGNLLLLLAGLVVFSYYATRYVPSEIALARVSGELSDINSKKQRLTLILKGNESRYGYISKGSDCGNLYERLNPLLGQSVVLLHDPNMVRPLLGSDYYKIYGFQAKAKEICSFARVSAMEKNSRLLGCMFGVGMMVLSLFGIFVRRFSGA
jgi:hypothetical protein